MCNVNTIVHSKVEEEVLWFLLFFFASVAFRIYDIDQDGFISNGELFQVRELPKKFSIA